MSSRSNSDEPGQRQCWVVRDRYLNRRWIVMFDPIPGLDRAEWIGEVKGPFYPLFKAQEICRQLNVGLPYYPRKNKGAP